MSTNKIVRSICFYTASPSSDITTRLEEVEALLTEAGFVIQTKRLCAPTLSMRELGRLYDDPSLFLSVGSLTLSSAVEQLDAFYTAPNLNFNIDLTDVTVSLAYVELLFDVIKKNASKTFNFTYVFNNGAGTPYFPSASYLRDGFSIGLQSTDLSEGCHSIEEWLGKVKAVWMEIDHLFAHRQDFLGIDSSIAPLFEGKSSFVQFLYDLGLDFSHTVTTDTHLNITRFIKTENPRPIGLCGFMLPCLEDFELAREYEKGNFTIERNVFLSLHSGLGVDSYPIGVDEKLERVLEILLLLQGLSSKYKKPLSCRLISDGKARVGDMTDFQNQYLKDVVVKPL